MNEELASTVISSHLESENNNLELQVGDGHLSPHIDDEQISGSSGNDVDDDNDDNNSVGKIDELELPDHDFSKLLDFDTKSDDALLSAANDLLNESNGAESNLDSQHTDLINEEDQDVEMNDSIDAKESTAELVKPDKDSPQFIINEKNNLFNRQRKDSLTPIMFQKHELPPKNFSQLNSSDPQKNSEDSNAIIEEQPTISAYARLDFQSFTFYVQTLHVIIGRRSENDFTHKVDVNLGPSKSISRRHAQIFYNFGTGRFELSVIGKNGAFIDDVFVERGNTVPLRNRTKIQIGQIPFQFILPEQEKDKIQESTKPSPDIQTQKIKKEETKTTKKPKKATTSVNTTPVKKEAKSKVTVDKIVPSIPETPIASQTTSTTTSPKKKKQKPAAPKEKKQPKPPKKVYTLNEIPLEYRTKPTFSYSTLLTNCIRKFSTPKGMSLSEIYAGIKELYPYYEYCPDGWQSSVRHNLSLNKSFKKVSKEGKGWLWGLDEEYIAEREKQKQKQAEAAAAKAQAAQMKLEQQQQQRAKKGGDTVTARKGTASAKTNTNKGQTISQTLAANRSTDKKTKLNDQQRTMKYLQEQLMILTSDRKGLSKPDIANILTQALAMTINQVTQAAKTKGIAGNPLTALMDKNPQHLTLILAAAVNAATSKVTKGKVKQLVTMPPPASMTPSVSKAKATTPASTETASKKKSTAASSSKTATTKASTAKASAAKASVAKASATKASAAKASAAKASAAKASATKVTSTKSQSPSITKSSSTTKTAVTKTTDSSFDPSSLSRFFQPKQPARVPTPPIAKQVVPQKRSLSGEYDDATDDSSSEDESTSSDDDDDEGSDKDKNSDGSTSSDDDDDDDDSDNDSSSSDSDSEEETKEEEKKDVVGSASGQGDNVDSGLKTNTELMNSAVEGTISKSSIDENISEVLTTDQTAKIPISDDTSKPSISDDISNPSISDDISKPVDAIVENSVNVGMGSEANADDEDDGTNIEKWQFDNHEEEPTWSLPLVTADEIDAKLDVDVDVDMDVEVDEKSLSLDDKVMSEINDGI
ncbi:hypothetical protein Kpol_1018p143 [Vanderwaltozyma polyspora DSM 70294]|uniref:Pre-rRNA-processing protein FHL1 n=1 Tax=Vanderwaltozyma polyspora (strain ATCC 22028 / DSM 70294 / BCRC 21397 / CBS 2163 / NBRC 10782 / NRRL Y-8283 / UCD 57-17) TaxID=436907 RepID=A7TDY5_VANPO|nr:uncharacterized protein Kpol_1018p143 [Vanderwaltozyma polyspora DSM 70294]EDO19605.1 hypothetical protein Kpol_1018p143 [Vanderwaltozyma polyspora DSM 70294]